MKPINVIRRPRRCPRCGGEICDILYGEPVSTWEEDHMKATGHRAVLGGCCIHEGIPDYQCTDCGLQFTKIIFPSNCKQNARTLALEVYGDVAYDVEYIGLYKRFKVYTPLFNEEVCFDGIILIFVNEKGKASLKVGPDYLEVIEKLSLSKKK